MDANHPAVGASGTIIVATRGEAGPGEVLLHLAGGTEAYLAYSETPLPAGTEVLVYDSRGNRSVDVMQFGADQSGPST